MGFEDRDYVAEKSFDREMREDWFTKPKSQVSEPLKIGIAVFVAIVAAWAVREMYYEYQARRLAEELTRQTAVMQQQMAAINERSQAQIRAMNAQNEARQQQAARQEYLNNYWQDIGNGIFINIGRTQKKGDITTVVFRRNEGQQSIDVNCRNGSFYSDAIHSWHQPQDPLSAGARIISAVCHS